MILIQDELKIVDKLIQIEQLCCWKLLRCYK